MSHTSQYKEDYIFQRKSWDASDPGIQFYAWFDSIWQPGFIGRSAGGLHCVYSFVEQGSYRIRTSHGEQIIKEGDFSIRRERTPYESAEVCGTVPLKRKCFQIHHNPLHDRIVSSFFPEEASIIPTGKSEMIVRTLNDIRDEMSSSQKSSTLAGLLFRLLHELHERQRRTQLPEPLNKAIHHMQENFYRSTLDREEIAKKAGVSIRTLSRLFQIHLSTSPGDYLIKLRLEQIRSKLAAPYLNMKEIAWTSGFNSAGFMTRLFHQTYGMTPTEYRKNLFSPLK